MKKFLMVLIIFTFCFGAIIYLKDGNFITGSILKYDSTNIVVKTSFGEL